MVWFDYLIIGIIALSTVISLIRGFIKEAISLLIWFVACYVALNYHPLVQPYLNEIEGSQLRQAASMVLLFVTTLILGSLASYAIGLLVKSTGLSGTDRLLGSCFGFARGVLVVSAGLLFLDLATSAQSASWWTSSKLIPEFKVIVTWMFDIMRENSSLLPQI